MGGISLLLQYWFTVEWSQTKSRWHSLVSQSVPPRLQVRGSFLAILGRAVCVLHWRTQQECGYVCAVLMTKCLPGEQGVTKLNDDQHCWKFHHGWPYHSLGVIGLSIMTLVNEFFILIDTWDKHTTREIARSNPVCGCSPRWIPKIFLQLTQASTFDELVINTGTTNHIKLNI